MPKEPSVTILITLKNNAKTIRKCIESLLRQNYSNYEIFVVDAFSTDGSYEILKGFGKKIKLYQLRGWPPKAYNWAIKRIRSEYVALIDGDCVADKKWIKELVSGFSSDDILAVAGYCGTPKGVSKLQSIIGRELESRFKEFPKFIPRAPTMNLCFRAGTARKIGFDESLRVSYDTDFGYRLTRTGKMYYNKNAIIYHYHRATWTNFFKQQYMTAIYVPQLYIKHKRRTVGDSISKTTMILQPHTFNLAVLGLVLSIFNPFFLYVTFAALAFLLLLFIENLFGLAKGLSDVFWFLGMFTVRNAAWCIGLAVGVYILLKMTIKSALGKM